MKWIELSESVAGNRSNKIWVTSANVAFVRHGGTGGAILGLVGRSDTVKVDESAEEVIALLSG